MHLYISTVSINSLENKKECYFKSIKYTVHFKASLNRPHFQKDSGFGFLVTSGFHTFLGGGGRFNMGVDLKLLISS